MQLQPSFISVTLPSALATTSVPKGAAISIAPWFLPSSKQPDIPFEAGTGHANARFDVSIVTGYTVPVASATALLPKPEHTALRQITADIRNAVSFFISMFLSVVKYFRFSDSRKAKANVWIENYLT